MATDKPCGCSALASLARKLLASRGTEQNLVLLFGATAEELAALRALVGRAPGPEDPRGATATITRSDGSKETVDITKLEPIGDVVSISIGGDRG